MSSIELTEPEILIVDNASDEVDRFLAIIGDEIEAKDYEKAQELTAKLRAINESARPSGE